MHLCLDLRYPVASPEGLASRQIASQKGFHCTESLTDEVTMGQLV